MVKIHNSLFQLQVGNPQAHQAAAAAVQAAGAQKAVAQLGALNPVRLGQQQQPQQAAAASTTPGQLVKVVAASASPNSAAAPVKTIVTTAGGQVGSM